MPQSLSFCRSQYKRAVQGQTTKQSQGISDMTQNVLMLGQLSVTISLNQDIKKQRKRNLHPNVRKKCHSNQMVTQINFN